MKELHEQRGKYTVNVYDVVVTEEMRKKCLKFAKDIILSDNQYSRLLPSQIRNSSDVSLKEKIEIQRTYLGKLGEVVFEKFLREKNKSVDTGEMFKVYDGQDNVDEFDFITKDGMTVDIKTGFRNNHIRLLVNCEQFNNKHKDYYVAVKLNAVDVDSDSKIVDWENITKGRIVGYAQYEYMREHAKINDFGEGDARYIKYEHLLGIDKLVKSF